MRAPDPTSGPRAPGTPVALDDFLSGESGTVAGLDALRRGALDAVDDLWERLSGVRARIDRAARNTPARRVLVVGAWRPENRALTDAVRRELERSRHTVALSTDQPGARGKFETLNDLLSAGAPEDHDWLLVVDDDVRLPRGFLDRFVFLCERFALDLAQPAHPLRSHAAWQLTRRRRGCLLRETAFVEIGPVSALARRTLSVLLPFPPVRMGWGLDAHWAALAQAHNWRCGVVDAVRVRHSSAPAASGYSREQAIAEARELLAARPYLPAATSQRTLATHRRI
ncbi:MAG: glycosyltransferase family 2 protein [Solirubrobacteraceae bacterium]